MDLSRQMTGNLKSTRKNSGIISRCWKIRTRAAGGKLRSHLRGQGTTVLVDPLIQALSDEDWRVRQKVAWALGYLGDPKAIPALRRAYRDDLEGVQEMITEAIAMITTRAAE